jgi:hypothetical protein
MPIEVRRVGSLRGWITAVGLVLAVAIGLIGGILLQQYVNFDTVQRRLERARVVTLNDSAFLVLLVEPQRSFCGRRVISPWDLYDFKRIVTLPMGRLACSWMIARVESVAIHTRPRPSANIVEVLICG